MIRAMPMATLSAHVSSEPSAASFLAELPRESVRFEASISSSTTVFIDGMIALTIVFQRISFCRLSLATSMP